MNERFTQYLPNKEAMMAFANELAKAACYITDNKGIIFYLNGDLGAGKTTLSRGIIQSLGYKGNVKSPTYTLVEEYKLTKKTVYHFDLYRLADPEELEFMGIRDYFAENTLCLIEWAERGTGILAEADLSVNIAYAENARSIELVAQSPIGGQIIEHLNKHDLSE